MRIAVTNWSSRIAGGAEQYLARLLPALTAAGHTVGLWTETAEPAARGPIASTTGITEWDVASHGAAEAIQSLARWRPDVLYSHGLEDPSLEEQLLDIAPAVFFAHGYFGTCISGAKSWKFPVVRPCSRTLGPGCLAHFYPHRCGGLNPATMIRDYDRQRSRLRLLQHYAAVVTHSLHLRTEYLRHGLSERRVHGVPYPVHGAEEAAGSPHSLSESVRRLLFVGRMDHLKGGAWLLQALTDVRESLKLPLEVTFAGDGPERSKWERLAADVTRTDPAISVMFPGWLHQPALAAAFAATDLLVVPSLWPEPFGQVGPEAGHHGVPVAAFAVGGIPDWLEEGVNGALAPGQEPRPDALAQAIVRCLDNPAVYRRLSEAALENAARFTMSRHLAALMPILEAAIPRETVKHGGRRPLRILVAHNVRCEEPGGMSRLMSNIHERVERAGHEVDYLCAEDAGALSQGPLARFRYPFLVWRRARAAARHGHPYDIINVHEPSAAAVAGFRRGYRSAVVVTSHGVEQRAWDLALEEARLGREGPRWKTRVWHPLTSLWQSEAGLTHADLVFCLNVTDRDYLSQRFGIPADRVIRIHPGADPIFAATAARRDYSRARRLLFAGTWRKNKGIEDFIPAFTRLAEQWPELELVVAGAGVPVEDIQRSFPASIRARISTVRTATDSRTAEVYAEADLYVLPSLFEGTPLTLIEAMMSGLAIVTTATSGMKDVIQHGVTGLLLPVRSPESIVAAVNGLLCNAADRERLGRAAQAEALAHYTWDVVAEPVISAYQALAERRL